MSDWKVRIQPSTFSAYTDLYIYRKIGDGKVEVMTRDSAGQQVLVVINAYESTDHINPTVRLYAGDSGEILKSLADAIHEQGVSTDNDARMRGLLEATKAHLEDMRKLVFK